MIAAAERVKPKLRGVFHELAFYSALGLGFALVLTADDGRPRIAATVFAASVAGCVGASALDHRPTWGPRVRAGLARLDHAGVYLLIAGTYTPFLLVNLRGGWGWSLFGVIWGLAMAGILFKVWFVEHSSVLSTAVYLLMGWLALVAVKPMLVRIPASGLLWLLAGGVFYTVGVVFYAWKKVPYNHAIWHGFVLAGSTCHYFAVLCSVILPAKALWTSF